MTCAQGLLRLLWGGAEVGVLRDCRQCCVVYDQQGCRTITFLMTCLGNEPMSRTFLAIDDICLSQHLLRVFLGDELRQCIV